MTDIILITKNGDIRSCSWQGHWGYAEDITYQHLSNCRIAILSFDEPTVFFKIMEWKVSGLLPITKFIITAYKLKRHCKSSWIDFIALAVHTPMEQKSLIEEHGWKNVFVLKQGASLPASLNKYQEYNEYLFIGGGKKRDHISAMNAAVQSKCRAVLVTHIGPSIEYWEKNPNVQKIVTRIGYSPSHEYLSIMQSCCATMVILSSSETIAGVTDVASSLALGKPVIVTKCNGMGADSYVDDGKTGVCVGLSTKQVSDGINHTLSNIELLSSNAKDLAKEHHFDWFLKNLYRIAVDFCVT